MKIQEVKIEILKIINETYKGDSKLKTATDEDIKDGGFVREKDAAALRICCKRHNFHASFRAAGCDTLSRIDQGNPCKGHTILDKSIKQKDGKWTYKKPDCAELDAYRGLVGYKDKESKTDVLAGLWILSEGVPCKKLINEIRENDIQTAYTGDYDMHDLFYKGNRIVADTVDEYSKIIELNNAMARKEKEGQEEDYRTIAPKQKPQANEYALIRHGAQTMYFDFLVSEEGKHELDINPTSFLIPFEESVVKIDESIVMFDNKGAAYILNGVAEIHSYYKQNNLSIPFFYYFNDLRNKYESESDKDKIDRIKKCALSINTILDKIIKISYK
jgi:hypothetical protein